MVRPLELRATQSGVLWPRRPLVSARGLLAAARNLPLTSADRSPPARFRCAAFSAAGDLLAAADEKGRVFVFFLARNRYALVAHVGAPAIACCFSPARRAELLVTCENETARCIDVHSQVLISTLRGHRLPARSASFQASGKLALTASPDAVILWDTADWSRFRVLNAGPGVEQAMFVAQGGLVAVCFQDDSVMVWELASLALRCRFSLPAHERAAGLRTIAVSDDHKVLVASGRSPFVYVWDFEAQTIIRIIELPPPITEVVSHAFVPDQPTTISILESGGGLFFLDVAVSKPAIKLEISKRDTRFTAFDIDCHARFLAACTDDGLLLLYDMEIARETAARAQAERRKAGLFELEANARLPTRSGLPKAAKTTPERLPTSRPVASKLIDRLFGATVQRRSEPSIELDKPTPGHSSYTPTRRSPSSPTRRAGQQHHHALNESTAATREANPLTAAPGTISAHEIEVNCKRLEASLRSSGAYPSKYRLLVWRFLLRLPKNEEAFRSLVRKGKHPAFVRLGALYPLRNARMSRRLHRVLSAIAFWCPAFGEVSYLPEVVYPFVKVFRENDLAAFEASLSVLLHWCGDFQRSLPHAPVGILAALDRELQTRDPQLSTHFQQHQISAEVYGWSLLKTIFTEVLSEDEWVTLWDHLFTYSDKPQLLYVAVLAYLSYFRTALLSAADRVSIDQFFHQQNAIQIQAFVQLLTNLSHSVDLKAFTFERSSVGLGLDGGDATTSADTESRRPAAPLWPLARGQYPAFASYPKFVVDFQISERNRIALEESEMVRKQQLLEDVEKQCAKLKAEQEAWVEQKRMLLAAEEKRRTEAVAAEKHRILNLKSLDHQTRARRLERLGAMEAFARQTLDETAKMFQAEAERLGATLAMQRERTAFEIASRQQEEELQRAEFESEKHVMEIHRQREVEERLQQLRSEFAARVKQQELQDLVKFESWRREDDDRKRLATVKLRRREELAVLHQERAVRKKLEADLLAQQVEKERELAALETERAARRKEQRALDALDQEVDERKAALEAPRARAREWATHGRSDESDDDGGGTEDEHLDLGPTAAYAAADHGARRRVGATRAASRPRRTHFEDREQPATQAERTQRQAWSAPREAPSRETVEPRARPAVATPTKEATPPTDRFAQMSQSLLLHSASSESSFTSAVLERTMEEMTLLEKALRNISSSSSSNTSSVSVSTRRSRASRRLDMEPRRPTARDARVAIAESSLPPAREGSVAPPVRANRSSSARDAARNESGESEPSSSPSSAVVQRPIAELEKELGIRFDEFSDEEEKEGESSDDDVDSVDEAGIEDDRARLLERAKRLLEEEAFSSEDDDGDAAEEAAI